MAYRFAQWLDITLSNRDIKGRTLAKKIGVHDSAISRWRGGTGTPGLDACMKLATELGVDPIRLAVTAELMDARTVGAEPLEMPEATAKKEYIKRQIMAIKGLNNHEVDTLLEAYEEATNEG